MGLGLVRFDGFDHLEHNHIGQKYLYNNGFDQGNSSDGKFASDTHWLDKAFNIFNTAFGRTTWDHDFGAGVTSVTKIVCGMWLRNGDGLGGSFSGNSDFFQLRYADGSNMYWKQLAFAMRSTNKIEIWRGGPAGTVETVTSNFAGTLVGSTAANVLTQDYNFFEFEITAPLGVRIRKNGTVIFNDATIPTTNATAPAQAFNRVGKCWESLGNQFYDADAYYLYDATGIVGNAWLGETRVTTWFTSADAALADFLITDPATLKPNTLGGTYTSLPPYSSRLFERFNYPVPGNHWDDGDSSYIEQATNTGSEALFRMARYFPVGNVLAVSITPTLRSLSATNATYWLEALKTSSNEFGPFSIGSSYRTPQLILLTDPESGLAWKEADFVSGAWKFGIRLQSPSDAATRVSQFVVEVLHLAAGGVGARNRVGNSN